MKIINCFAGMTLYIFLQGCSSLYNTEVLTPKSQTTNKCDKLNKVLETVERYYIVKTSFNELVNITINGVISELKDELSPEAVNSLKQVFANDKDLKNEAYLKLASMVAIVTSSTKNSSEETIRISLKVLMDHLDPYSMYINRYTQSYPKPDRIKPFHAEMLHNAFLYLSVQTFDADVTNNIQYAIQHSDNHTKGIILDLRNNTGGLLNQAIGTVDLFISEGIIITEKGRDTHNVTTFTATPGKTITDLPLVILVNKRSASSSEIVSGALQDLHRATIIGEKTFGKGTIQAIIPISKDKKEAIKLTIAKYYLPNGKLVDHKIIPDIEIIQDGIDSKQEDQQLQGAVKFLNATESNMSNEPVEKVN